MTNASERPPQGIIVPLATPLTADEELDIDGLARLIEHVIVGGVHGIFILGTSGEGPSLAERTKRELIEHTLSIVTERVPVIVGVSDTSLTDAADLAKFAADLGATAVAATPPFYFPLEQPAVISWFQQLSARQPLPLLLYNFPGLAKTNIEPETAQRLMDEEDIVGIKDSSGDLEYFARLCELGRQRPDWSTYIGPEEKLAEALALGATGGVCGGANVRPRLFVDWYEAARQQDQERVLSLGAEVSSQAQRLYGKGDCQGVIQGLKRALSEMEICGQDLAHPLQVADRAAAVTK